MTAHCVTKAHTAQAGHGDDGAACQTPEAGQESGPWTGAAGRALPTETALKAQGAPSLLAGTQQRQGGQAGTESERATRRARQRGQVWPLGTQGHTTLFRMSEPITTKPHVFSL